MASHEGWRGQLPTSNRALPSRLTAAQIRKARRPKKNRAEGLAALRPVSSCCGKNELVSQRALQVQSRRLRLGSLSTRPCSCRERAHDAEQYRVARLQSSLDLANIF